LSFSLEKLKEEIACMLLFCTPLEQLLVTKNSLNQSLKTRTVKRSFTFMLQR